MAKVQHNRATAAWILQIGFSRNTKCAIKDGFRRDSHICSMKFSWIYKQYIIYHLQQSKCKCFAPLYFSYNLKPILFMNIETWKSYFDGFYQKFCPIKFWTMQQNYSYAFTSGALHPIVPKSNTLLLDIISFVVA